MCNAGLRGPHERHRRRTCWLRPFLLSNDKHLQLVPYWDFNYPKAGESARPQSGSDCVAEFRNPLTVRLRLRADVR
jgi:hypothetical protein